MLLDLDKETDLSPSDLVMLSELFDGAATAGDGAKRLDLEYRGNISLFATIVLRANNASSSAKDGPNLEEMIFVLGYG